MTPTPATEVTATEVFKALGDPIRWSIVRQMGQVEELACSTLEETLPISKPTISYHTKILTQAGLVTVRKQGRNFFYTLRRDVLRELMDDVSLFAPEPRPAPSPRAEPPAAARPRRSHSPVTPITAASSPRLKAAVGDDTEAALLTW